MASAFVDTSILIDILRNKPAALAWFGLQVPLSITPILYMEVIAGVENNAEKRQAMRLLSRFDMIYLEHADMRWAIEQHLNYKLSHGVGMMDCLIASVSFRLQLPVYTVNLKHFRPLLGELAQKLY